MSADTRINCEHAAGTTGAFIQTYGLMQGFVKKGDLRPIAVTSGARAVLQPDVAMVAETYPGFQMTGWVAYSTRIPASITTFAHRAYSARNSAPNASGLDSVAASIPIETRRFFTSG
ncbi:MAG: hypothetical protein ACKVQT_20650 [Burkholderiales bacterium]